MQDQTTPPAEAQGSAPVPSLSQPGQAPQPAAMADGTGQTTGGQTTGGQTTGSQPAPAHAAPAPGADSIFGLVTEDGQLAPEPAPQGIPDKFKRPDGSCDMGALARGYQELEKKLYRGDHQPPESPEGYGLPTLDGMTPEIPANDPVLGAARKAAHAAGLSPAQWETLASGYLAEAMKHAPQQIDEAEHYRQELASLGPNGPQQVRAVKQWIGGLASKGTLSPDEVQEAYVMGGTAKGLRVMSKLMALSGEKPMTDLPVTSGMRSLAEIEADMGSPRYVDDPTWRRQVREEFSALERAGGVTR